jgi:hypothetical protein
MVRLSSVVHCTLGLLPHRARPLGSGTACQNGSKPLRVRPDFTEDEVGHRSMFSGSQGANAFQIAL